MDTVNGRYLEEGGPSLSLPMVGGSSYEMIFKWPRQFRGGWDASDSESCYGTCADQTMIHRNQVAKGARLGVNDSRGG